MATAIEFYKSAFDAKELRRWSNDDGSVHVAELVIEDALFHLHEEVARNGELSPGTLKGTSVILGLFVAEPDAFFAKAIEAGAKVNTTAAPIMEKPTSHRRLRNCREILYCG